MRPFLWTCLFILSGASCTAAYRCDPPEPPRPGIRTASNCVYEVVLRDGLVHGWGAYTVATGPHHPVTEAFGELCSVDPARFGERCTVAVARGDLLIPARNFLGVRSWGSRTDYHFEAQGTDLILVDQGFTCIPSHLLPRPEVEEVRREDGQLVGLAARFEARERGDDLRVTIRLEARGEGFEDSAVLLATTVENLSQEEARIGIRHLWVPGVMGASAVALGPVPPDPPEEPWTTQDGEWVDPSFDRLFFSWTNRPSVREPYYFAGSSVHGPWTLDPVPTPPERITRAPDVAGDPPEKAGPANSCFAWDPADPPKGSPHGGAVEAMTYEWGYREEDALLLPPGCSVDLAVWVWAFIENPVTCDAGGPYGPVECTKPTTPAPLDGSDSHTVEGNPLLYRWSSADPAVAFDDPRASQPVALLPGPGSYPLALDVGIGPYPRSCDTTVEVVDTTPPVLRVPAPLVLRTSEHGPEACDLPAQVLAEAEDACWPDVRITHTTVPFLGSGGALAAYDFPPGTTRILFTAEDPSGNVATAESSVTVVDDTPPVFTALEAHPALLWPPNHKLAEVEVRAEAWDNCDASPSITLLRASSSEPEDDRGDGETRNDIQGAETGTADFSLLLRAERDGRGPGRTYSVLYVAEDDWGNQTPGEARVVVPHDMGLDP